METEKKFNRHTLLQGEAAQSKKKMTLAITDRKCVPYHTYQVPHFIFKRLEEVAENRRRNTGAPITWTDVMRGLLEKKLFKKK